MPVMPETVNGLAPLDCISAMQKAIRRAEERTAMEVACELSQTSPAYFTMAANRLRIILHEDIDVIARPELIAAVETTLQQAAVLRKDPKKLSKVRMLLGTVIRLMARAPKNREGDHFHVAVGRPIAEGRAPTLPEYTWDKHTRRGKQQGRGLTHFLEESTKLIPAPETMDPYYREAVDTWRRDEGEKPAQAHAESTPAQTALL